MLVSVKTSDRISLQEPFNEAFGKPNSSPYIVSFPKSLGVSQL
jgi:hypothetical protein